MTTDRAILFANPHSGRARRWLFQVIDQARELGVEFVSVHFNLDGGIDSALEVARRVGVQAVLAAGGDGTVGGIAGHLVGTDFTLGVLPAGTSNDFARSLGLPLDPRGSLQVVRDGFTARIDVGEAADRVFVHAAAVGLNTEFAERADKLRRYLHRASYPVASVWTYRRRQKFQIDITTDTETRRFDTYQVTLVNAPAYGGGLHLEVQGADLRNRRLCVVVVEEISAAALLRSLPSALVRGTFDIPGIQTFSVRQAQINSAPSLRMTLDGEEGPCMPVTVRAIPRALQVFVPQAFLGDEKRI